MYAKERREEKQKKKNSQLFKKHGLNIHSRALFLEEPAVLMLSKAASEREMDINELFKECDKKVENKHYEIHGEDVFPHHEEGARQLNRAEIVNRTIREVGKPSMNESLDFVLEHQNLSDNALLMLQASAKVNKQSVVDRFSHFEKQCGDANTEDILNTAAKDWKQGKSVTPRVNKALESAASASKGPNMKWAGEQPEIKKADELKDDNINKLTG